MFRCEKCNENSKAGEKLSLVTVETREKEYPECSTVGWEIVKQIKCCTACATTLN